MRLTRLSLRGVTVFSGTVEIDFDSLGLGLIALCGVNGSGKSTIMGAAVSSLYKVMPDRPGHLQNYCHGTDAFIESVFEDHGDEIKVRVQIDADRRKTETYIFLNGASLTTGRSAEHESEIEKRFGSLSLLMASVFASQGKQGNFLQATKGQRKELFGELLGLAYLEVLAESAKDRGQAAQFDMEKARVEVTGVEAEVAELTGKREALSVQQSFVESHAGALDSARTEEAAALAQLERARGAAERLSALQKAEQAAARELAAAEKMIAEAGDASRKAATRYEERLRFLTAGKAVELGPAAVKRHAGAMERLQGRRIALEAAMKDAPDEAEARADLTALEVERDGLEEAERQAMQAQADHKTAAAELNTAAARLAALVKWRTDEIARLTKTAGLLPLVPCTRLEEWEVTERDEKPDGTILGAVYTVDLAGTCPLLADARGARERVGVLEGGPSDEEEAAHEAQVVAAANERDTAARSMLDFEAGPARRERRDLLKRREEMVRAAISRAQAAVTAKDGLRGLAVEVDEEVQRHAQEIEDARQKVEAAAAEARTIQQERDAGIVEAQERLAEAQGAVGEATARHESAQAALDLEAGFAVPVGQAEAQARSAKAAREAAEKSLREADQHLARIQLQVEQLAAREASLPALRVAVTAAERELGDWSLLARALGKDGVQALEIDAAGPEVARITNELLESCYGPRFSISLETLREKKSARGEYAEAFDIRVMDAGAERPVEALSGGEKVVIGEALGLAIAILNARKSGIRYETLWRDETAGALDPDNAQAYVLMLRRARELGGFSQVIFVSHQPEVWEAADVRLIVSGGRVSVEAERIAA